METLKVELNKLGKVLFNKIKSIVIFLSILVLWVTNKYYGISPFVVVFMGAIIALLSKIGIVAWNDVDIPWFYQLHF